ncbi:recombinase family protein [Colwellia piezophila]|uniref:recombinase family protein n=1 Tax=Colwellia piezophila TaxID=211668 RepID=UPI000378CDF6|nr:recombinase family protein [Colwellia piezophila]
MANVAYLRVSTTDQNLDRQLADIGITFDKTFEDKVSGSSMDRPALINMLDYVRSGDTLYVHSIDRLARNLGHLNEMVTSLTSKGISVVFHKESLTFTGNDSPMNSLLLNLLGSVYQFERAIAKEG